MKLTDRWMRGILTKVNRRKRKGTTGKVEPSPQFFTKEKFIFQRAISAAILCHDTPDSLVLNIDQTTLTYVSPGTYIFNLKDAKNVPINGVDDLK